MFRSAQEYVEYRDKVRKGSNVPAGLSESTQRGSSVIKVGRVIVIRVKEIQGRESQGVMYQAQGIRGVIVEDV